MKELREGLIKALSILYKEDFHLVEKDLNERTIAHKLANYIQFVFKDFDVDCEYNGNIYHKSKRKLIDIYLRGSRILCDDKEHSVFPDIIIHKRGSIKSNRLIIEIKKSTNRKVRFDTQKLIFYTHPVRNRNYKFEFGCLVKIYTGDEKVKKCDLIWYKDGTQIEENKGIQF